MSNPAENTGGGGPGAPAARRLAVSDVTVRFDGVKAIDGVSLEIATGEIVGLIGPNGAGKTTLVNVISGFQEAHDGAVTLDGEPITSWSPVRRARAGIARSFQAARLFERISVRENIEAAAVASGLRMRAARTRAEELLEFFELGELAGLEAGSLPHGLARRLGIARGLASAPAFLLLDEPAAGLDEEESAELAELLREVRRHFSLALVVIEHDVPLIMSLSDRIHVLHHGKTLADGTPAEVSRDETVVTAYLGEASVAGG